MHLQHACLTVLMFAKGGHKIIVTMLYRHHVFQFKLASITTVLLRIHNSHLTFKTLNDDEQML